jgi:molybdate transport repressor ModE-like protein
MLDVRRMKVLREVAARGSFSAAAEALSFTQSAVSQHVAALERETGMQLVEREPRGIRLTEAGRALVAHADAVLARLEDAEQELAAIAGLRGGRLQLASFQSAGATLVPQAVRVFHERYPDVELRLVQAEPEEANERVRAGETDIALVYDLEDMPGTLDEDLELTHLLDDEYHAVLSRHHRLADRSRIRMKDLTEESWINSTPASGCRQIIFEACRQADFNPRVAFETDDIAASQAFVAAGVGVTLLPELAVTAIHPGVVVRSLGGEAPVRRIWAARKAESYRSPASEAMIEVLQDVSAQHVRERALAAAS